MADTIDVLLINPGDHRGTYQGLGETIAAIEPPVFAGLFATYLRKKGKRVAIYDVPATRESAEQAVTNMLAQYAPKLVVLVVYGLQPSASTQNMPSAGKIARLIKAQSDVPVMMTGTHPAALPDLTMREEQVDFVCSLEGPVTILKTVEALEAGTSDFSEIPSLWWKRGKLVMAPQSAEALVADLDTEMPGIAWDLLDMSRYRAHNWHCFDHIDQRTPYASIHTSLGCPFKCNFCCINAPFGKNAYRMWSPETVVAEIDHLVKTYGVKNIKFVDEMFVLNRRHVEGICDLLIERGYDLNIWAYARVDTVKDDMLGKLRAAGFNWLCLGIESGSEHVRDGAEKSFGSDEIIDIVRKIQAHGIRVMGNYIFGLPDDTHESMQATLDLALELNCEFANFYSAMAYPGSQLYTLAQREGIALPPHWGAYSQHARDTMPLANKALSAAEILAFRDQAFNTYFSSSRYRDMVLEKFGQPVLDHLDEVLSIKLRRNLLEEAPVTA
ncbi:radical SAM protein [Niveibacterium sp.]|uniref:B12-binding domain-containing radical SAM protein n=1 Tax=Niveibacterium sp. TaxID=2017444 RepID=UPI0035B11C5C